MKALIFTLALMPVTALAQFDEYIDQYYDQPSQVAQPVYGIPVQPILPVPHDKGPWGTGYSVITTTRNRTDQRFDRDVTSEETVTRIVPNDFWGDPIRGLQSDW